MLKQLERKLGRFCVPHLTWILIGGQVMFFLGILANHELYDQMVLIPDKVKEGEIWRLLVFMFIPETLNIIWFVFAMYILYLIGNALEAHWGEFRYNLYIFVGMLGTIGASFLVPEEETTNFYLMTSLFLAFAYLYPDFEFYLFFILPVKVKYLGMLSAVFLAFSFISAPLEGRLAISAAMLNFSLFFGRDMARRIKGGNRRMIQKAQAIRDAQAPFHTCSICKRTDKTDPQLHFRYLPGDGEPVCYCEDHLPE